MIGRFAPVLLTAILFASGCKDPLAFEEPIVAQQLGGQNISAKSLDNGRQMYVRQCYACHGLEGDGRGPSSPGLRPAPRDLRLAKYKFVRMVGGDLPSDKMLYDLIRGGLHGTAMLPWDIQDDAMYDIINYIKTFSPEDDGWRDPENEIGEPIELSEDPYAGNAAQGVEDGKYIYHGLANCQSCHPAFGTKEYIRAAFIKAGKKPEFREDGYHSAVQTTEYEVNGVTQTNLPPDYTLNKIRSVRPDPGEDVASWSRVKAVYRIVGAGVNGTAMAAWQGTLDEKDLWAVSYYVDSLIALKDTQAAWDLKKAMAEQPEIVVPSEDAEEGSAESTEAASTE
jgi:mono/diheme cytochrome c family protein